jgi:hypothetical protein
MRPAASKDWGVFFCAAMILVYELDNNFSNSGCDKFRAAKGRVNASPS